MRLTLLILSGIILFFCSICYYKKFTEPVKFTNPYIDIAELPLCDEGFDLFQDWQKTMNQTPFNNHYEKCVQCNYDLQQQLCKTGINILKIDLHISKNLKQHASTCQICKKYIP